jgi:hypothetical protein
VEHIDAGVLRSRGNQRVREGNAMLPCSTAGKVTKRSAGCALRRDGDRYFAQERLLSLQGRELLRMTRGVQQLQCHNRAGSDLSAAQRGGPLVSNEGM